MKPNDLGIVSLTKGKPDADMTNEQWQDYFSIMKQKVKPGKDKWMKSYVARVSVNGYLIDTCSEKYGETLYSRYCQFINSVLHTIRGSKSEPPSHDYCFYIYQIADLLRFEHDCLNVVWRQEDRYFEVWLDK